MPHGVDRYRRPAPLTLKAETARLAEREAHRERQFNDLWRTLPDKAAKRRRASERSVSGGAAGEHPLLRREVLAEARAVAARAGAHRAQARAVFLSAGPDQGDERGLGDVLALHDPQPAAREGPGRRRLHARVPEEPHQRHRPAGVRLASATAGINPYALGFAMFSDLRRICETPDAEDRAWFPDIAGSDWRKTLDFAMRNFKDESFIAQYLSPRLIREFHLFAVADHADERHAAGRQHPRRARLPARAQAARAAARARRSACPTCRSCATTATATGR